MSNLNRAQLLGNVGASPEMSYLPDGKAVVKLSIATNEEWVDKQGKKQQHTEWHRVTAWGKLAESCSKYLTTGRQVLVEGKIRTRSWEGPDGKRQYSTEIVASQVHFLGTGTGERNNRPSPPLTDEQYYEREAN